MKSLESHRIKLFFWVELLAASTTNKKFNNTLLKPAAEKALDAYNKMGPDSVHFWPVKITPEAICQTARTSWLRMKGN